MARGATAEERRPADACPLVVYGAEDEQYRGRAQRLTVLRVAAGFETYGRAMCEAAFGPLAQAASSRAGAGAAGRPADRK